MLVWYPKEAGSSPARERCSMQPCAHPAGQSREIAKRGWHHPGLAGLHLPHHVLRRLSVGLAAAVLGSVLALGNITARPACAEEASTENVVAKAASAEPDVPAAVAVTDGSNPGVPVAAAEVTQGEGSAAKAPVVGAAEGTTTSNVEASNSQPSKTEVPTVSPAPADTVASSARATRDDIRHTDGRGDGIREGPRLPLGPCFEQLVHLAHDRYWRSGQ